MTAKTGPIYIGIGGWTFEPWRGVFYPDGLPHSKELAYAAARLTSIEVNGTFYRTQTPFANGQAKFPQILNSRSRGRVLRPTGGY